MSKPKQKMGRVQPMRATQPYQLLSQSPVRRSPCSSPTPRNGSDPHRSLTHGRSSSDARMRHRWATSPDSRQSPSVQDSRSERNSPIVKVTNRRSPSPSIRRSSSNHHDNITTPYLIGQWPRELSSQSVQHQGLLTRDKSTQTPTDWNSEKQKSQPKIQSRNDKSAKETTEFMRQQIRRIKQSSQRQNNEKKESRKVGNHTALSQLATGKQILMNFEPPKCFGRTPRRQNSNEALNKEMIDILMMKNDLSIEPRYLGITPPDGHRAPFPARSASTRSIDTQTKEVSVSRNASPKVQKEIVQEEKSQIYLVPNQHNNIRDQISAQYNSQPKYASSPRPNNSYKFKRQPPDGAEQIKVIKENNYNYDSKKGAAMLMNGPDKNKVNFKVHTNSKWKKCQNIQDPYEMKCFEISDKIQRFCTISES